jgi:cytochrome P450
MARAFLDGRLERGPVVANRPSRPALVPRHHALPSATLGETLGVVARVLAPIVAEGPILRRPRIVGLAERLDLERGAIAYMQQLRRRRRGPLMFGPLRGRTWALVLSARHAQRVLHETPDPFATASAEKIAALAHFEPRAALISHGAERVERRALNEAVLETGRPVHAMADAFTTVVAEEVDQLLESTARTRELAWPAFSITWSRIVRRIVFGDAARDDAEATDLLARLRADANWAFLRPIQEPLRERFLARVHERLSAAPPGTLAAATRMHPSSGTAAAADQVPQWLFAFDAAGMATVRAAALLASHPLQAVKARREMREAGRGGGAHELRYVRACVLESLRLWPTTPLLLRQTVEETRWDDCVMPAQTGIVIFAPFFHRDEERLPFAHRFWPEVWLQDRPPEEVWTLLPFSDGPARCPGRQLVELIASTLLARLFDGRKIELSSHPRFGPHRPLPVTLGHHALRFTIA